MPILFTTVHKLNEFVSFSPLLKDEKLYMFHSNHQNSLSKLFFFNIIIQKYHQALKNRIE